MFVEKRPRKWQVGRKYKGYNGISGWCWMAEPAFFISNILDYNSVESNQIASCSKVRSSVVSKSLWRFGFGRKKIVMFLIWNYFFFWIWSLCSNFWLEYVWRKQSLSRKIFLGNWKFQIFWNFLVRSGTSTHKNKQKVHILPTVSF